MAKKKNNIKSFKYPKGKEGSMLYEVWFKKYGIIIADEKWKEYKKLTRISYEK